MNLDEGDRVTLTVGPVAHGGVCVARVGEPPGLVVFVRHALPGERVVAEVTSVSRGFVRADAVSVLSASSDRVEPPCPYARPGLCGGCDLQHVSPSAQLVWKASVVREQLSRLGGLSSVPEFVVEPLPGGPLGWRSRVRYAVDAAGRAGLLKHRSHEVVPVDRCLIAHPLIQEMPALSSVWEEASFVDVVASASGDVVVVPSDGPDVVPSVRERAVGRDWAVPAGVFWQVHPAAADALAGAVVEMLAPRPGEAVWDLYGGVGLFAAAVAPGVGPEGAVTVVEASGVAVATGRSELRDLSQVRFVLARVDVALRRGLVRRPVDLVVLDPPRSGAGAAVVRAVARSGARAVVYVACDPAAFARDVRTFGEVGWGLAGVRAFDCFPMTHHVECVGLLTPK